MLVLPLQALSAVACVDTLHAIEGSASHSSHADHGSVNQETDAAIAESDTHLPDSANCDCCFGCHGGIVKVIAAASHSVVPPEPQTHPLSAASRFASADPRSPEHVPL